MSFEEKLIFEVRSHPIVWDSRNENYKNRLKSNMDWEIIAQTLNKPKDVVKIRWRYLRDVFQKELKKVCKPQFEDPGNPHDTYYTGKWAYFKDMLFLKDVIKLPSTEESFLQGGPNETYTENSDEYTQNVSEESAKKFQVLEESIHQAPHLSELNTRASHTSELNIQVLDISRGITQAPDAIGERIQASKESTQAPDTSGGITQSYDELVHSSKMNKIKSGLTDFQLKMLEIEERKIATFKEKKTEVEDEDTLFFKSLFPSFKHLNPVQNLRLRSKIQTLIANEIGSTSNSSPVPALPSPVHAPRNQNMFDENANPTNHTEPTEPISAVEVFLAEEDIKQDYSEVMDSIEAELPTREINAVRSLKNFNPDDLPLSPRAKRPRLQELSDTMKQLKQMNESGICGHDDNECDIFGRYVSAQLKKMSTEQCILSQEQIQAILTRSRLNDLRNQFSS